ncbi:MAG: gluconate 2-dehydrogenase subunit 3 family protein [Hyphomicrobiales bacterium]|nr:gluconate 2-dehydrogenase subunit 3 family protein [Nitratireductor sp.]MCC2098828.1 gluconate 2-dehydrogenase subunit 3 family protein [Hyphomicrobiales bacterium]
MSSDAPQNVGRRSLITGVGAFGAGVLAAPLGAVRAEQPQAADSGIKRGEAVQVHPAPPALADGYQSLGLDEAAIVEALVAHMWPADDLSPDGVVLGIATFIDRQLAGAYGQGDRLYLSGPFKQGKPEHGYQLACTPEQYFKDGLRHLADVSVQRYSSAPDRLTADQLEDFLRDISSAPPQAPAFNLNSWFNELFYPLFVRGAFADPIYGGNRGKQAWRMIGYPGLPATYATDMVTYRGRRHPASDSPMSIQDFS